MPYTPSGGYYELSATGRAIKAGSKTHPGIERGRAMARIKAKRMRARKNPVTPAGLRRAGLSERSARQLAARLGPPTCYLVLSVKGSQCLKGARMMQEEVKATGRLNIRIIGEVYDAEVVSALITDSINVK